MFEFFLSLFGGGFLLSKYLSDKGDARQRELTEEEKRGKMMLLTCNKYISNIQRAWRDRNAIGPSEIEQVRALIGDDLVSIFSAETAELILNRKIPDSFVCYPPYIRSYAPVYDIVIALVVAKKGFIYWPGTLAFNLGKLNEQQIRYAIEVLKCVERDVQKIHPDVYFAYQPDSDKASLSMTRFERFKTGNLVYNYIARSDRPFVRLEDIVIPEPEEIKLVL